jgi:hypothetical protein
MRLSVTFKRAAGDFDKKTISGMYVRAEAEIVRR